MILSKTRPLCALTRVPRSGLGNQLFSLNSLIQIASSIEGVPIRPLTVGRNALTLLKTPLEKTSIDLAIGELFRTHGNEKSEPRYHIRAKNERVVWIPGGHLGAEYCQVTHSDPKSHFHSDDSIKREFVEPYIALHFRGGDFARWNPDAVLDFEYYAAAVSAIDVGHGTELPIVLVSDDESLHSFSKARNHFRNRLLSRAVPKKETLRDFWTLSQATALVSSPSTFAIWASILGSGQTYHSKKWVSSRAALNDGFWVSVANGSVPFLSRISLV